MKKPGIKRPKAINGKAARNTDNKIFFLVQVGRIWRTFLKEEIVTLFDIIKYFSFVKCLFLSYICIFITPAAKHILVVINVEDADWTEIVASLALEFFFVDNFSSQDVFNIVGGFGQKTFFKLLLG